MSVNPLAVGAINSDLFGARIRETLGQSVTAVARIPAPWSNYPLPGNVPLRGVGPIRILRVTPVKNF